MFPALRDQLLNKTPESIKIASIVKAELLLGAEKSKNPVKTKKNVNEFLLPYTIIPFDDQASVINAQMRGTLEKKGIIVGPNDLVLASTVLANNGILVTNNVKEFNRVPGLKIENWTR